MGHGVAQRFMRCTHTSRDGLRCALDVHTGGAHNALGPWVPGVSGYELRVHELNRPAVRSRYAPTLTESDQPVLTRMSDSEIEKRSHDSPGERLRWLRQQAELSMGDLARFLKCSVVEVSRIESGRLTSEWSRRTRVNVSDLQEILQRVADGYETQDQLVQATKRKRTHVNRYVKLAVQEGMLKLVQDPDAVQPATGRLALRYAVLKPGHAYIAEPWSVFGGE